MRPSQSSSLLRNIKVKSVDRGKNYTLLQTSPEEIKKQQKDTDRVMKELVKEGKDVVVSSSISQKKKQAKKTDKDLCRDPVHGQDGNQKEEHNEEQG